MRWSDIDHKSSTNHPSRKAGGWPLGLAEMAIPDESMRGMKFYHGSATEAAGLAILQTGLQPGNTSVASRGHLQPVVGRTYLTTNLRYGIIYAIGGDMLGCSEESVEYLIGKQGRGTGRYGYLFVVSGDSLAEDVIADEDSIGAAVSYCNIVNYKPDSGVYYEDEPLFRSVRDAPSEWRARFLTMAKQVMTARQFRDGNDGATSAQASGGKRMQKSMSPGEHLRLINMGAHVAYRGPLTPSESWRFDKTLTPKLKKDGSNFFDLAERLP